MRNRLITGAILAGLLLTSIAAGQTTEDTPEQRIAKRKAGLIDDALANIKGDKAARIDNLAQQIALYLAIDRVGAQVKYQFLSTIEDARVDKQVGSSGQASGTTTLVAKGAAPAILGFAVENGALERAVNGTSVTFRGNPLGITGLLSGLGYQEIADSINKDLGLKALAKFSFATTFDTSRGGQPGTLTANSKQLSQYSFRYEIVNHRDPRDRRYEKAWSSLVSTMGAPVGVTLAALTDAFGAWPELQEWVTRLSAEYFQLPASAGGAEQRQVVARAFDSLKDLQMPASARQLLDQFLAAAQSFRVGRDEFLREALRGALVTFDYLNSRDPNVPVLHTFRFIAECSFGRADLTANGSFSIFNSLPANVSQRLRDFQLAGQLDVPLGEIEKIGSIVFSLAGRWERLPEDTAALAGTASGVELGKGLAVKKGNIGIAQAKLTLPVKGSGVKIPISISVANRTELIQEKDVRVNFGITFDFDSILARLAPGKK